MAVMFLAGVGLVALLVVAVLATLTGRDIHQSRAARSVERHRRLAELRIQLITTRAVQELLRAARSGP